MPAIRLSDVRYRYGDREAIRGLSLDVTEGEAFVLLGPNGSGKTTLFRLLSTLAPPQEGRFELFGHDLRRDPDAVRSLLGVVFQAPSLDKKLTVAENLLCHGRLYGLAGTELKERVSAMLERVGLADRAKEAVDTLSGGLRRRVELAKGLLHKPRLLLLDEPSTGLDPAARSDLWRYLMRVREEQGVTILATTHLLEEADRADRIAIMHRGELAALDTPANLQASVGGDAITIRTKEPALLAAGINGRWPAAAEVLDGAVRLEQQNGAEWAPRLFESFGEQIDELTIGKPTLEDVFIARTGHRFFGGND
ncbi:MAG: ATP-binding cassette domain-containing protein [Planctomycetota bacterium]